MSFSHCQIWGKRTNQAIKEAATWELFFFCYFSIISSVRENCSVPEELISWVGRWCSAGRALRYSPAGKDCFLCEEQLIFPLFLCVQRSLCCIQRIPGPALPQSWGRTGRRGNEAAPAGAGGSRKQHTGTESQNPEGCKRLSGSSAPTPPCPPLKPLLK